MSAHEYLEERAAVAAAQNRCRSQGLQSGNGGNISMRIPGTNLMAVKASNAAFAEESVDAVVVADYESNLVTGSKKPSKESVLHGLIYQRMPEVGAIVHCHSPWANGWSAAGRAIPMVTYHAELKLGGPVPVIDTGGYMVGRDQVAVVLSAFAGPPSVKAVVLQRHGLVAVGKDLEDAACNAELVEETAHTATLDALLAGVP